MASIQNKVIHRFIHPIESYESGGTYYNQVIPLNTQAYAIYPAGEDKNGLYYVFGDGNHTYTEIRDGKGSYEFAKEFPVFEESKDSYTKEEIDKIIKGLHQFNIEILDKLPEVGVPYTLYLILNKNEESSEESESGEESGASYNNDYYEYLWIDDKFEIIGGGAAGNYVTKDQLTAKNIKYKNGNISNVKEALDYLLYLKPEVFLYGSRTYEKGTTVKDVYLWWDATDIILSQYIDNGVGFINKDAREYTIENANITSDTTYTITVSDGKNTASSSIDITFKGKVYYGAASTTELTRDQIISFDNDFENITSNSYTFDCSGGKYFYIILPAIYQDSVVFKINGFVYSDMSEKSILLENENGYMEEYIIYKSNNIQTGSAIQVEYTL